MKRYRRGKDLIPPFLQGHFSPSQLLPPSKDLRGNLQLERVANPGTVRHEPCSCCIVQKSEGSQRRQKVWAVERGSQGTLDYSYFPTGMKLFQFLNNCYSHTSEYQLNIRLPIGKSSNIIYTSACPGRIMALLKAEGFYSPRTLSLLTFENTFSRTWVDRTSFK